MLESQHPCAEARERTQPDILQFSKKHLHNAKLWVYGSFLVVGGIQIILRENFPQIKPPWPWIAGALAVGLIGYILIPPILQVVRIKKS